MLLEYNYSIVQYSNQTFDRVPSAGYQTYLFPRRREEFNLVKNIKDFKNNKIQVVRALPSEIMRDS